MSNDKYGWERVKKFEGGWEMGFLKERILFNLSYFHNTTDNQLLSYPLPVITGFTGVSENLPAIIRNSGIEIELLTAPLRSGKVTWRSGFNLTIPKNKLVKYPDLASSSYANTYEVGMPLFIAKRYQFIGVNPMTGKYEFVDLNGDNVISNPSDRQFVVFTGQQYYGGWFNSVTWRNFNLSMQIQFIKQKSIPSYVTYFSRPGTISNQPVWVLERWRQSGDDTDIQAFTNSNSQANAAYSRFTQSNAAYSNGSFLRGKNLYLSYLFKPVPKKSSFTILIYGQLQNFFTISKYKGLDPETRGSVPPQRIIAFGI
ncbi:MAG TPA: TonB-dependent receptor, partial [Flavobacterium sp.]|nr:TonB-dependent receptor [Flavobacterium sp.]